MHKKPGFWIGVFAGFALAACSGTSALRVGQSGLDDVQNALGAPALRWQDADGSTYLAYPSGPEGTRTLLFHLDAGGRLKRIENTLDAEHFAAIKPGMGKEQVLHALGPPTPQWTAYFGARDELVWEWRYCDVWNALERFDVLFDASRGEVRSTMSHREECGAGSCLCTR